MFEYDPPKSEGNLVKHGIDFEQAQAIWGDSNGVYSDATSVDEVRFRVTGMAIGKLWSAFYTVRDGAIRIISVRRARDAETRRYYEHQND